MSRKTKDTQNEEIKIDKKGTKVAKKETTAKKNTKKSDSTAKKTTTKKAVEKKEAKTKSNVSAKKITTTRKNKTTKKKTDSVEYYDLPNNYEKTIIKILAQTPKTLFIYWELSNADAQNFRKIYGDNFFNETKPVLIVHNDSLNYSFEVEINDFANSWYLHVDDAKSDYRIEIGRKPISNNIKQDYIYITSSNEIESPNDKILFDESQKIVFFRNVKTNAETKKDISSFSFMKKIGKIYNIYDIYKEIYKNEVEDLNDLSNPSSTSSRFM